MFEEFRLLVSSFSLLLVPKHLYFPFAIEFQPLKSNTVEPTNNRHPRDW